MVNMIMYIIMQTPAPTMIVYPSDDLAKNISNDNLKPAFRLVPEIKKMFKETKSKELELRFTHMPIYLTGAGSPSKLASKPTHQYYSVHFYPLSFYFLISSLL